MVGTGAGNQNAAGFQGEKRTAVQVGVAFPCFREHRPGFGECGRVQNDYVKRCPRNPFQVIENISGNKG